MTEMRDAFRVAYFAHDWGDAAIKRRVAGFARDHVEVSGFASYRRDPAQPDWVSVNLGQTFDNGYVQRVRSILRGAQSAQISALTDAHLIVARNLDMLLMALLARRWARLETPVIYECLDIHHLVARSGFIGTVFRAVERRALRHCVGHWVSSPAFLSEHFQRYYPEAEGAQLLENRLQARVGPRPEAHKPHSEKLRIGWFGNLRCARSLKLLCAIASQYGDRVEIVLRGYPAETELPDFHQIVAEHPNMTYAGRYRWPDDLEMIYNDVDVVWAGDFMDAGLNSQWLLPNRLYEGGWYACPPIAPSASQTGQWIKERQSGFVLDEPLEKTLSAFVEDLLQNPHVITVARERLLGLSENVLIEPEGTLSSLVAEAVAPSKDAPIAQNLVPQG